MKFTIASKALLVALQQASSVMSTNLVLSILEDFHFHLEGDTLHLSATDLETFLTIRLPVQDASGEGKICIPSKTLLEYVKKQPADISFDISPEKLEVLLKAGKGKGRIAGETAEDFPHAPEMPTADITVVTLMAEEAIAGLSNVAFCTSKDAMRPAMTGVFLEIEDTAIHFTATDAHRLSSSTHTAFTAEGKGQSLVLPKRATTMLLKMLPAVTGEEVELTFTASHLCAQIGEATIFSRTIDARFPDWRAVMPKDNPFTLEVDRQLLIAALQRIGVFSNKTTSQVVFSIDVTELTVSAQDEDFQIEGSETLDCKWNGDALKIAFNARLLTEIIQSSEDPKVAIKLATPSRAMRWDWEDLTGEVSRSIILMPLRIGL